MIYWFFIAVTPVAAQREKTYTYVALSILFELLMGTFGVEGNLNFLTRP